MNIYFACSITGGRQDEANYQVIVKFLIAAGHTVPTASLASSDVIEFEVVVDPVTVYERDTGWIRGCDVLIAEVSTPSHGVGYEIGYALGLNKPVICLHREGAPVSKMITGNRDPNLSIYAYVQVEEVLDFIENQLRDPA